MENEKETVQTETANADVKTKAVDNEEKSAESEFAEMFEDVCDDCDICNYCCNNNCCKKTIVGLAIGAAVTVAVAVAAKCVNNKKRKHIRILRRLCR